MSPVETALDIEVEAGHVTTLRLHGCLNAYTVERFASRVEEVLKDGAYSLVVNVAGIGFLDSEGVGALLRARRRVQARGGTLLLAEVTEQARKTIAVKGLSLVLLAFGSEGEAASFLTSGLGVR